MLHIVSVFQIIVYNCLMHKIAKFTSVIAIVIVILRLGVLFALLLLK